MNCFTGKGIQRELSSIYKCAMRLYDKTNYVGKLVLRNFGTIDNSTVHPLLYFLVYKSTFRDLKVSLKICPRLTCMHGLKLEIQAAVK